MRSLGKWSHPAMALVTAAVVGGSLALLAAGPASAQPPNPAPRVAVGALATSASTVYLTYTGTDGAVYLRNETAPRQGTTALGGRLIGGPAVAQVPAGVVATGPVLTVFGRGTDRALWFKYQTSTGWSGWRSLGGVTTSEPAVFTPGFNPVMAPVDVFARGSDGMIWFRMLEYPWSLSHWSPWYQYGTGSVMANTGLGADGSVLAATGVTGHVRVLGNILTCHNGTCYPGYGFVDFGGKTTTSPGVTAVAGHKVEAFARGTDNALWTREGSVPLGPPTGPWRTLGGRLTTGVTATTAPGGATYVFGLGTDNQIWIRTGIWPTLGPWTRA